MTLTRVALLTAVALVSGCASMSGGSSIARNADLTRYTTYDWVRFDTLFAGDSQPGRVLDDYFEGAIAKRLTARGLHRPSNQTPDLLLHYRTSLQGIHLASVERMYRECTDGTCRADVADYDEVLILLDAVDARTKTSVWRGSAAAKLNGSIDDRHRLTGIVDSAVTRLLQGFPPARQTPLTVSAIAP